jgi:hypothetical protein
VARAGVVPAADVGGVGRPVAGGGALPLDRDGDVDAEHAGQDCGGQVGGELEQRGGTGLAAVDADLAQPFGDLERADRLSGLAAGEQPGRGAVVAEGCMAAAGCRQLQDQIAEGPGSTTGPLPSRRRTWPSAAVTWSSVRRLTAVARWA